jgi:hypothetical protein
VDSAYHAVPYRRRPKTYLLHKSMKLLQAIEMLCPADLPSPATSATQEAEVKAKFGPAIKEGASAEKALEAARAAAKQAVGGQQGCQQSQCCA